LSYSGSLQRKFSGTTEICLELKINESVFKKALADIRAKLNKVSGDDLGTRFILSVSKSRTSLETKYRLHLPLLDT